MHQQTKEVLALAPRIAEAADTLRDIVSTLSYDVADVLTDANRESSEALFDEPDPALRGLLDGQVCQRARAASDRLARASRELAACLAAVRELSADLARLEDAAAPAVAPGAEPAE
jgi:hypothetical protein